ncbi:MAG: hypothetical protein P8Y70_17895 [Candidatus Lokiarchaeota archaeon]
MKINQSDKKHNKKTLVIFILVIGIFAFNFNFLIIGGHALYNGPNYWGMGFPGGYHPPMLPSEYRFIGGRNEPEHYGSHDWCGDATIRILRNPLYNPTGFEDWYWLMNSKVADYHNPKWESIYANSEAFHRVVRSYISFLFATEMPDAKDSTRCRSFTISQEAATIGDISSEGRKGKWVGQTKQHRFFFNIIEKDGENTLTYTPDPANSRSPEKCYLLAKQAIKCITNSGPNSEGETVSKMKPEAAAAWLGAMSHFIFDLASPGHLIAENKNIYVKSPRGFHFWFEAQLSSLTLWSGNYAPNLKGPDIRYFSADPIFPVITPIRPDIAINTMAYTAIGISYGINGSYLYDENNLNSGVYINNSNQFWDWKEDLSTGVTPEERWRNSEHENYYKKVQLLLSSAIYYCACAMQWVYNEAEETAEEEIDPNGSAKYPPIDDGHPIDPKKLGDKKDANIDKARRTFENLARLSPALIPLIPQLIKQLIKKYSSRR